ncbi:hypothetical protein L904_22645 [Agrobacterium sp. LY4]|nr:hypothetical protein L904_22645 [Agrobacterium sp. LY4]
MRINRPELLRVFQTASFLLCRSGGRGVPSDQEISEPIAAENTKCADMRNLPEFLGVVKNETAADGDNRRRLIIRKGMERGSYSAAIPYTD